MAMMTVEKQLEHINNERNIIEKILLKNGKLTSYDSLYIKDLENKIKQREEWIREQNIQ